MRALRNICWTVEKYGLGQRRLFLFNWCAFAFFFRSRFRVISLWGWESVLLSPSEKRLLTSWPFRRDYRNTTLLIEAHLCNRTRCGSLSNLYNRCVAITCKLCIRNDTDSRWKSHRPYGNRLFRRSMHRREYRIGVKFGVKSIGQYVLDWTRLTRVDRRGVEMWTGFVTSRLDYLWCSVVSSTASDAR